MKITVFIFLLVSSAAAQLPPIPTNAPPGQSTNFVNVGCPFFSQPAWTLANASPLAPPGYATTSVQTYSNSAIALFTSIYPPAYVVGSAAFTYTNQSATRTLLEVTWTGKRRVGIYNAADRLDLVRTLYWSNGAPSTAQPAISITATEWVTSGVLTLLNPGDACQFKWSSFKAAGSGVAAVAGISVRAIKDPVPAKPSSVSIVYGSDGLLVVRPPTGFFLQYAPHCVRPVGHQRPDRNSI